MKKSATGIAIAAILILGAAVAGAAPFTAFGPRTYTRANGQPVTERAVFSANGTSIPQYLSER